MNKNLKMETDLRGYILGAISDYKIDLEGFRDELKRSYEEKDLKRNKMFNFRANYAQGIINTLETILKEIE